MKIALTSQTDNKDSMLDARFGRCAYFAIYDTDSKEFTFLENPAKDSESGAGPAAVAFVAKQGISKIVSGEFGMKIKGILESLNIEMISVKDNKTITEILSEI